jgi:hypothetical protein
MTPLVALFLFALVQLAPALPSPDYEQALVELDSALEAANSDPEAGLERLALALQELARHPEQLIDDPVALEKRTTATLTLARGYAGAGEEQLAIESMDQALREAGDTELLVERFGPRTRELAEQRRAALTSAGYGSIEVACAVACIVYVDEREVSNPTPPLWLGSRRVVVRALEDELASASWVTELTVPDDAVGLVYPEPVVVEPEETVEPEPAPVPAKDRGPAPLLTSGGMMLAGGIALTAFGITRIARGTEVHLHESRSEIQDSHYRPGGAALTGIGLATLAIGITLMALEPRRARKARDRNHLALDITPRYLGLSLGGQF